jgi:GT2 family glycosyltransferase
MGRRRPSPAVIYTGIPFALDMNLGAAYNDFMRLLPEDAWAVFLDHDAAWTTRAWFRQLHEAIAFKPDAGAIVAVSNRIGPPWQQAAASPELQTRLFGRIVAPDWREHHNMANHRRFGAERMKTSRTLLDVTDTKGFGGVAFAVSRAAWARVGGFVDGMLCVDHGLHFALKRAGLRIYALESLYVYHWRRAFGDELPKDTPRAADCPCRGPEIVPRTRIALP